MRRVDFITFFLVYDIQHCEVLISVLAFRHYFKKQNK